MVKPHSPVLANEVIVITRWCSLKEFPTVSPSLLLNYLATFLLTGTSLYLRFPVHLIRRQGAGVSFTQQRRPGERRVS